MKKSLLAALAVAFSLALSGCELITGAQPDDSSTKPSVHGQVSLQTNDASPLPANAVLRIRVSPVTLSLTAKQARASADDIIKTIQISAYGTYSYAVTDVPDGQYYVSVQLSDTSGTVYLSTKGLLVTVTGGSAAVDRIDLYYSASGVS